MANASSKDDSVLPVVPDINSHAINDTVLRKAFVLLAVFCTKHFSKRTTSTFPITKKFYIKYGTHRHLSEAAAMQKVATETAIPVPKVYCAFQRKEVTYILMERLNGDQIGRGWSKRSQASKDHLLHQLRDLICQLRLMEHPVPGKVASADLAALHNFRISADDTGAGPFTDVNAFHIYLRKGMEKAPDGAVPDLKRLINMHNKKEYKVCFTHGDLSCQNILVKDQKVVGLIDWELSGWLPEYWEYSAATEIHPFGEFWREEIGHFLDEYEMEATMEGLRRKLFHPI